MAPDDEATPVASADTLAGVGSVGSAQPSKTKGARDSGVRQMLSEDALPILEQGGVDSVCYWRDDVMDGPLTQPIGRECRGGCPTHAGTGVDEAGDGFGHAEGAGAIVLVGRRGTADYNRVFVRCAAICRNGGGRMDSP